MDFGTYYKDFKLEVITKQVDIDPDNEYDWFAISVGWALAKGLTPLEANNFALFARYDKEYN